MLPGFPLDWARRLRQRLPDPPPRPRGRKLCRRSARGPTLADIGFTQQAALFDRFADWQGRAPLVIDSDDIRADPAGMLAKLCAAIGIAYTPRMLHWPAGGHASDGIWAQHWYGAVHRSTGFEAAEGPLPDLTGEYAALAATALPYYETLARHRIA